MDPKRSGRGSPDPLRLDAAQSGIGLSACTTRPKSCIIKSVMNRRTKVVCTLGPAVDSKQGIQKLIEAGMNVARLNCSHGDWQTRRRWVGWIRELSPKIAPVGILV